MTVQTLSLQHYLSGDDTQLFIEQLLHSLTQTGFVRITDHGLETDTLKEAYRQIKILFDLPLETKNKYALPQLGVRGYTGFGKERAKGQHTTDLKEFWHIGKELDENSPYFQRYAKNLWPQELPEFAPFFNALFSRLENIALQLLNAIGEGLGLISGYFPELIRDGNSVLRLLHYPATDGLDSEQRMRAAPHADINLMTLLVGATDAGLQLLDKQNNWVDVQTDQNEIVVDTGDMMALLTGNTLPATIHRVINPDNQQRSRYSMPFFLHPHSDAVLTPLPEFNHESKQPVTTAEEFLQQRLADNGLG